MKLENNAWQNYFIERSKNLACSDEGVNDPIAYGRQVYSSPKQLKVSSQGVRFIRWLVMEWQGEFNIFLEKSSGSKKILNLVSSFNIKEKAIKFALEMCLICNGKLNREKTLFD